MKIVLIDDDKVVCHALRTIIEASGDIKVMDIGHSYEDALRIYAKLQPDIILMDIRMGKKTGLEAGVDILKEFPEAKILYLTTFLDNDYIIKALNIGAKGYLLKQDFENIVPALNAVFAGQNVFGDEIVSLLPNIHHSNKPENMDTFSLTQKEMNILGKIAEGLNNREIGEELFLSEGTVRNYVSTILEKLDLRDRTQAAVFFWKNYS